MTSLSKILLTGVGLTLLFKSLPMRLWGLPLLVLAFLFIRRMSNPFPSE